MFFLPKLGCTQHGWHEDLRFWTRYFCGNTFSIFNLNLLYLKELGLCCKSIITHGLDIDWTVLRLYFFWWLYYSNVTWQWCYYYFSILIGFQPLFVLSLETPYSTCTFKCLPSGLQHFTKIYERNFVNLLRAILWPPPFSTLQQYANQLDAKDYYPRIFSWND